MSSNLFGGGGGGGGGQTEITIVVAMCCCSSMAIALFLWYAYYNQEKFTWLNWFFDLFKKKEESPGGPGPGEGGTPDGSLEAGGPNDGSGGPNDSSLGAEDTGGEDPAAGGEDPTGGGDGGTGGGDGTGGVIVGKPGPGGGGKPRPGGGGGKPGPGNVNIIGGGGGRPKPGGGGGRPGRPRPRPGGGGRPQPGKKCKDQCKQNQVGKVKLIKKNCMQCKKSGKCLKWVKAGSNRCKKGRKSRFEPYDPPSSYMGVPSAFTLSPAVTAAPGSLMGPPTLMSGYYASPVPYNEA